MLSPPSKHKTARPVHLCEAIAYLSSATSSPPIGIVRFAAAAGNSQLLLRERHFIAYPTEIQQKAMLKCNLKMLEMYFRRPYNRVI
jgi:hypothetical protein